MILPFAAPLAAHVATTFSKTKSISYIQSSLPERRKYTEILRIDEDYVLEKHGQ